MESRPNTVTLSVASPKDASSRALAAFAGEQQGARISFASVELLWKVLTPKRWTLLRAPTGQGPMSIREALRRDVKAVHGDVQALLDAGLLEHTSDGRIVFLFILMLYLPPNRLHSRPGWSKKVIAPIARRAATDSIQKLNKFIPSSIT